MRKEKCKVLIPSGDDDEYTRLLDEFSSSYVTESQVDLSETIIDRTASYAFVRRARLWTRNSPPAAPQYEKSSPKSAPGSSPVGGGTSWWPRLRLAVRRGSLDTKSGPAYKDVIIKGLTDSVYWSIIKRFVREILLWAPLSHPNVGEFLGWHLNSKKSLAYLVCPWYSNGNAKEYIAKTKPSIDLRLHFVADTAEGLKYLHSGHIHHGNIKAENIMINDARRAVITNFAFASLEGDDTASSDARDLNGSLRWFSPELFESGGERTVKSDVWAWGFTAYEIMTGFLPHYDALSPTIIMDRILARKVPNEASAELDQTPKLLIDLFQAAWATAPGERPTMAACVSSIRSFLDSQPSRSAEPDDFMPLESPPPYSAAKQVPLSTHSGRILDEDLAFRDVKKPSEDISSPPWSPT